MAKFEHLPRVCVNCIYYDPLPGEEEDGECHRYPPIPGPGACDFPPVAEDDWCGEFVEKAHG